MKAPKSSRVPLEEKQFSGNNTAGFYDEHARRFMGAIYQGFAKKAAGIQSTGNRVLDIGTGNGLLPIELSGARPEWQVTGIDISEEMLKLARENAAKSGLHGKIVFQQASAAALPFQDGSYDIVVSNASLHLWEDPVKIFNEIARVTAPGGCFLLWDNLRVPSFYPFFSLIGRIMGMNMEQRCLWLKAIRSSYTAGEIKNLLKQSDMKGAQVKTKLPLLELCIEWRKLQKKILWSKKDTNNTKI
jgi:ubiquinone/menaquinone biosynthesis C-methylase UbiE